MNHFELFIFIGAVGLVAGFFIGYRLGCMTQKARQKDDYYGV